MKKVLQQGFSLIELMISILLGTILLLGVMQVMISSSTLGTTSNNLSVNQDTARTVLDLLGGEAQRAGYKGCGTGGVIEWDDYNDASDWQKAYPVIPLFTGGFGLRFTYAMDSRIDWTSAVKVKGVTDCLGKELYYRSYDYKNCDDNGVKSLCITGTERPGVAGNLSETFKGVTLDKVVFTVPKETEIGKETFREISIGVSDADYTSEFAGTGDTGFKDINGASLVTFYITVKTTDAGSSEDAMTAIKREYSASYPLRNLGN